MEAHLKARQLQDLQKDLARNLRSSDGPYSIGEKIFYWYKDPTKFHSGRWYRGKVVQNNPPMLGIDNGKEVMRINVSKLRRDHDPWHDCHDITIPELGDQSKSPIVDTADQ